MRDLSSVRPGRVILMASLLAAILSACGVGQTRARYVVAVDPGSRYSFEYVKDRPSGQWVQFHCELRVPVRRPLPDLVHRAGRGDLLSFSVMLPGQMGSAGIDPAAFALREGHRVWLWREVALPATLEGTAALGVQASWPAAEGGPARAEAMEVFRLPRLETLQPYVWSPWRQPDERIGGSMAGWERLQGTPALEPAVRSGASAASAPTDAMPFEARCRVVLSERLVIPIEGEDANIGRPDPTQPAGPAGAR